MDFLVICTDAEPTEQSQQKRLDHLQAHLEYVKQHSQSIQVAGPIVDDASQEYRSSCFIYRADSREQALDLLMNDPYFRAELYKEYSCNEFRAKAGNWVK